MISAIQIFDNLLHSTKGEREKENCTFHFGVRFIIEFVDRF